MGFLASTLRIPPMLCSGVQKLPFGPPISVCTHPGSKITHANPPRLQFLRQDRHGHVQSGLARSVLINAPNPIVGVSTPASKPIPVLIVAICFSFAGGDILQEVASATRTAPHQIGFICFSPCIVINLADLVPFFAYIWRNSGSANPIARPPSACASAVMDLATGHIPEPCKDTLFFFCSCCNPRSSPDRGKSRLHPIHPPEYCPREFLNPIRDSPRN